jgi:hypothetical protein
MTRPLLARLVVIVALAAMPAIAFGQVTITELGAANAARNEMMANSAGTGAAAAPAPQASPARTAAPSIGYGGMKYALSYALSGMLIGLGVYLVCRPANRHPVD